MRTNANPLEPQLQHNREQYDRLLRRKRQLLVIAVLSVFPITLLVPDDAWIPAWIGLVILVGCAFAFLEIRRVLIFRRDLRERREDE